MHKLLTAALLAAPLGFATPVTAQDRVLTIFGNDKCPENTICVRAPETERFRIPKVLRDSPVIAPNRQSWAARSESVLSAGARSGIGSCTPVGPGGWTGCYNQQMQAARADKAQAKAENAPNLGE